MQWSTFNTEFLPLKIKHRNFVSKLLRITPCMLVMKTCNLLSFITTCHCDKRQRRYLYITIACASVKYHGLLRKLFAVKAVALKNFKSHNSYSYSLTYLIGLIVVSFINFRKISELIFQLHTVSKIQINIDLANFRSVNANTCLQRDWQWVNVSARIKIFIKQIKTS